MRNPDVELSKHLSLVLRHRPASVGIELDAQGWVPVPNLLQALANHGPPLARDDLDRVVANSDKQRFEWDREQDRIRARQGHSVPVDLELEAVEPPERLFHGTVTRNLFSIMEVGLKPQARHHVHLSSDVETARKVGARRGKPVVLEVDAAAMTKDGHHFWVTDNGIWLTDHVPSAYLRLH